MSTTEMDRDTIQTIRLSSGIQLAFRTAGDRNQTALVLLHGLPNFFRNFRDVIEPLSRSVFVVPPDLPGFGDPDVLPKTNCAGSADCIGELLSRLNVEKLYIYLQTTARIAGVEQA